MSKPISNREKAQDLENVLEQMTYLMSEARSIVEGTSEQSRAEAYWIAHIEMALDDQHGYLGGSMCTISETINCLREEELEDE